MGLTRRQVHSVVPSAPFQRNNGCGLNLEFQDGRSRFLRRALRSGRRPHEKRKCGASDKRRAPGSFDPGALLLCETPTHTYAGVTPKSLLVRGLPRRGVFLLGMGFVAGVGAGGARLRLAAPGGMRGGFAAAVAPGGMNGAFVRAAMTGGTRSGFVAAGTGGGMGDRFAAAVVIDGDGGSGGSCVGLFGSLERGHAGRHHKD